MVDPEEAVSANALVRQALVSAQEVMGENGLNAVLYSVGPERFVAISCPMIPTPLSRQLNMQSLMKPSKPFMDTAGKGYCGASVRHPFYMASVGKAL
jgi:hypothetical protein